GTNYLKMPRLEDVANIALRVPSILVLDLLYKCDIDSFTEHLKNEDMLFKYKYLYLHILTTLLFYVGHQISKDYVHGEVQYGYDGALYLDSLAFHRFVTALTSVAMFLLSNQFVPYRLARAAYSELLQLEVLLLTRHSNILSLCFSLTH
ncbi:unnamed protein product, partial [Coregonus sp. 'balchen']